MSAGADTAAYSRLEQAAGIARGYLAKERVVPTSLVGSPATQLLAAAQDSELLVLGHGGPYLLGDTLGAVSQLVVTSAACPVVIVAGVDRAATDPDATSGHIVAGIKHLDRAEDILVAAFREAELRNSRLEVVHAWQHVRRPRPGLPLHHNADRYVREVGERLDNIARVVVAKYPEVPVTVTVPKSGTIETLTRAARTAEVLVVGAPHLGPVRGTILGAAGQALLGEDSCPVMFVPR